MHVHWGLQEGRVSEGVMQSGGGGRYTQRTVSIRFFGPRLFDVNMSVCWDL